MTVCVCVFADVTKDKVQGFLNRISAVYSNIDSEFIHGNQIGRQLTRTGVQHLGLGYRWYAGFHFRGRDEVSKASRGWMWEGMSETFFIFFMETQTLHFDAFPYDVECVYAFNHVLCIYVDVNVEGTFTGM